MRGRQRTWAVVLAAGDGTRLSALTTDASGNRVPKQFCSLNGDRSLLQETLRRARGVVPLDRVCIIVAEQHARHWRSALRDVPRSNVIVQPVNRGTANGVLLCVLSILERDPLARIIFLPADHYVQDEVALAESLRAATILLTRGTAGLVLIGMEPESPDPELGYIVPGETRADGSHSVAHFVEKPDTTEARKLVAKGALWNSFIFAGAGPALLGLLRMAVPSIVDEMATALAREGRLGARSGALAELYERLPSVDFSRAVMQGAESLLQVIPAPACGWTDLGTPARVAETLRRLQHERLSASRAESDSLLFSQSNFISLAAQSARLGLVS